MDHLSNMLSNISIGYRSRRLFVKAFRSKFNLKVLKVLYSEGFIRGFSVYDSKNFIIFLKYIDNETPLIMGFKRVSSSGRRVFASCRKILKFYNSKGLFLISTNYGIVTSSFLQKNQFLGKYNFLRGGEILFKIIY